MPKLARTTNRIQPASRAEPSLLQRRPTIGLVGDPPALAETMQGRDLPKFSYDFAQLPKHDAATAIGPLKQDQSSLVRRQPTRNAAAATSAAQPKFRVILVPIGMNRLNDQVLTSARTTVDTELDSVSATSRRRGVKAGFNVEQRTSLSAQEARSLAATDFVVYLVRSGNSRLLELTKRHVQFDAEHDERVERSIANQIATEGGVNIAVGRQNVSFVAVDLFERELGGPLNDDERLEQSRSVGEQMAEVILHEVGHGLGASHDQQIMAPTIDVTPGSPPEHFSRRSKRQIVNTLDRLDR